MKKSTLVAAIQMVSGQNLEQNLNSAALLCREAASKGAKLLCLPENFALLDSSAVVALGNTEAQHGRIQSFIAQLCRELQVWIVAGSIPLAANEGKPLAATKVYSACLVFDDTGGIRARYNKMHLFDVDVSDDTGAYRESDRFDAGSRAVVVDTPFGVLGLAVCYDLRFPELFSDLTGQGADIIVIPSAFTYVTGKVHWELLLRARAIETQCFVIGVNQGGQHTESRRTWGHSMIIDPWGEVISALAEGSGVAVAALDQALLTGIRKKMPIQQHRKYGVLRLADDPSK